MTTNGRLPLLFSPLDLGPVTVRNRIVFAAHLTNYATNGLPSAQHAAYYQARAAGGAGLIITEEHSVHPTDWPYEKLIHGFRPEVVEGYRRITDAVHGHNTPIFAQINHNGGQASGMYSRLPVWAPSPVADPLFREVPKELEEREIKEIVEGYALVASHCMEGGFDGIELQCSHSSIVRGFLSPATNLRTDRYGGSLANRARLLLEITAAVRKRIGFRLALGVRLCGDELIEGGTTIDDAVEVAKMVQEQGLVDYVNTSIGVATASLFMIEASMHIPPGYSLFIPSAIRNAIDLPVVGVGRFKDPVQAERALQHGYCDLVGAVRAQIADPDFASKARVGLVDDIRLCLSCNQECVGRMGLNRWLGCIENPRAGKEELPAYPKEISPKNIVVVGAGPAGMQAAITSAERGHSVVILERDDRPGGQIRLAASVPSRAELGDLIRNQIAACARSGVEIRCGVNAGVEEVMDLRPDAVIIATGSLPNLPPWAPPYQLGGSKEETAPEFGSNSPRAGLDGNGPIGPLCADVCHVLDGTAVPTGRVLVIDELGFHQATSVAELLADRGCAVEIATPAMVVGQDLGITLDMESWNIRAAAKGITQSTDLVAIGFDATTVHLLHHPTGTIYRREVDWVVLAVPPIPEETLYYSLRQRSPKLELHRVGDCLAPRRAHAAVIDGDRIAARL